MTTTSVTIMVFFLSTILELLDHSYVESSFATISRLFNNGIWNDTFQFKILQTWISIGTNYFLSKFLETTIGKSAWKIVYTIIRPCSSKNIALIIARFFFSQIERVFKFNMVLFHGVIILNSMVVPIIFPTIYLPFFTFDILFTSELI